MFVSPVGRKKTEKKINKPRTFNYNCAVTNAIAQLSHLSLRVVLVCRLKFQVRFHSLAARLPLAFSMTSSSLCDSTSHTWGRRRSAAMKECNVLFRLIQPWLGVYTIWCLRRANRRLIKQSSQIRTVRWSLAKKLLYDVRYFWDSQEKLTMASTTHKQHDDSWHELTGPMSLKINFLV